MWLLEVGTLALYASCQIGSGLPVTLIFAGYSFFSCYLLDSVDADDVSGFVFKNASTREVASGSLPRGRLPNQAVFFADEEPNALVVLALIFVDLVELATFGHFDIGHIQV